METAHINDHRQEIDRGKKIALNAATLFVRVGEKNSPFTIRQIQTTNVASNSEKKLQSLFKWMA